ncbi:glycoside hydrolase [Aspergillus violaceofuscus CBS 115571]|uniref:Glycoside hydrolase n=1 Tax=Aspergillus violaceofuscus (strain CBS 115571) TaxID=1450538 RepID=A0A2V5H3A6_ASPV1|nr:glycoside hydrolase [Aspergillus violaceofuscus CBS 115571]
MEFWAAEGHHRRVPRRHGEHVQQAAQLPRTRRCATLANRDQPAADRFCNGGRMPEFLAEMTAILRKHRPAGDAITVGELPNTPHLPDVLQYCMSARPPRTSSAWCSSSTWSTATWARTGGLTRCPRTWTLSDLRARVGATQTLMDGTSDGWSTAVLENHDQARCAESAKMLAILVARLSGTLFLYQGQEIGMVNAPPAWDVAEYKDVDSVNYYRYVRETAGDDDDDDDENPGALRRARAALNYLARDHARLPMQWNALPHAGFTDPRATPWMRVHDNYPTVNVKRQASEDGSGLNFWRGVDPPNEAVFVFEKMGRSEKLVVALSFIGELQPVALEGQFHEKARKTLVKDYEEERLDALQPCEGRIYMVEV